MSRNIETETLAKNGVHTSTGTDAVTGKFGSIQVLEDAEFSVFTEVGGSGDAMTGFTVTAGTVLYGVITAYTLASGKVRAHRVGTSPI